MPVVQVYMWSGRTIEQKRKLADGITKVFGDAAGVPAEAPCCTILGCGRRL